MSAVWPVTLPEFWGAEGFVEREADNVIATPMDTGPAKRRRRSTAGVRSVDARIDLTEAQYAIMRAFFQGDCAHGAIPFTRLDAHGVSRTFSFRSPVSYMYMGHDWWAAQLELEEHI